MTLITSISGIRGTIGGKTGENLTPPDVVKFVTAYGSWVKNTQKDHYKVVIGRDARVSGQIVSHLVTATLNAMGIDVVDLGLSTTPTVEIAVPAEQADGGIIITASHNPIQWNALKLLNSDGEFITGAEGESIIAAAEKPNVQYAEAKHLGKTTEDDSYLQKHIDLILAMDLVDVSAIKKADFRIVVDAVNSSGGIAVPALLKALGVKDIKKLYCEPNGHFAHNPEPLPDHLSELSSEVKQGRYDLGIAVDPDVDRLAFICEDGSPFGEEYTLVAVADYVLSSKKTPTVSNLSSTRALRDIARKHGVAYHASAVGEVNVTTKMKATGAAIGGEGNGGVIVSDLHYGRDALAGIALFLSHLAKKEMSVCRLRNEYPNYHISKNKIELTPQINVDKVLAEMEKKYSRQPTNTEDGVRIEFDKEWVHLRKSNTEPIIRIYTESDSEATANYLANKIMQDIKEIIAS